MTGAAGGSASRDVGREPIIGSASVTRRRTDLNATQQRRLASLAERHRGAVLELALENGRLVSPLHPFVAKRDELPHTRLQAHGRALLTLLESLLKEGWTFADGDPQNFAWSDRGPILIDWGSPVPRTPANAPWTGLRQLCETVLFPLALSRRTGVPPTRWLKAFTEGVDALSARAVLGARTWRGPAWLTAMLLAGASRKQASSMARGATAPKGGDAVAWTVRGLARAIERLGAPQRRWQGAGWARHRETDSYSPAASRARRAEIAAIAEARRPRRVLDLGAHHGALLAQALRRCEPEHAIALDSDPGCTTALSQAFEHQAVTVLEADLLVCDGLHERLGAFEAELTIACGLVHHLALARSHGVEHTAQLLDACVGQRRGSILVSEWIPGDDAQLRSLYDNGLHRSAQLGRYSLDALLAGLGRRWSVETLPLPGTRRRLLRCERIA